MTKRVARRAALAMVVVTVGVAAGVVLLYLRQDQASRVETARAEALHAAREQLPQVLSYRHDTLDRDLDTAFRATTGTFQTDLAELQRTVIRPAAAADKIDTRTTVSDAGVVHGTEQEVVVLAFLNQLTTSQKQSTPRIDGARVRVIMLRVGDGWLISRLDTL
jgi:Mce-associated membrane protein